MYDAFDPVAQRRVWLSVARHAGVEPAAGGSHHPGWLKILRVEEDHGTRFCVVEPFDGEPLEAAAPLGRKISGGDVAGILKQVAGALDDSSCGRRLPGGFSPALVFASAKREVRLVGVTGTSPERMLGRVHYLAPEQLRDGVADGRSRQFSLAVLAHQLLTGEVPFPGESAMGVTFKILFQAVESAPMKGLPPDAQSVLRRALSKEPNSRYATCQEMASALEEALTKRVPAPPTREVRSSLSPPAGPMGVPVPAPPAPGAGNWHPRILAEQPAAEPTWLESHHQAVKYFGATFGICVVLLGGLAYFLAPKQKPVEPPPLTVPAQQAKAPKRKPAAKRALPGERSGQLPSDARRRTLEAPPKWEEDPKPVAPRIVQ